MINESLVRRSWLFCPANHSRRLEKALASAAHAVILDLEDAVAESEKGEARVALSQGLSVADRPGLYVRINALGTAHAFADIEAAAVAGVEGIILPKAEAACDVEILDWLLQQMERKRCLRPGAIGILPLIESAKGFENLLAISRASPRIRQLTFGAADFTTDLRLNWSDDERELASFRASLVLASRQAGLLPPIDTPWIRIADRDGMVASAHRSRDHGFDGKLCIHPDQIDIVNEAYAPSMADIEKARQIVEAFEAAGSAVIKFDSKMIDYPIVEAARRLLTEAGTSSA